MKGARQRLRREHNDRAWQAWQIAHLPHQERRVRFRDLIYRDEEPAPKSWEDEFAAFESWARAKH